MHGLSFGTLLDELALRRAPEPWSLLSYHAGAVAAQLAIVGALAAALRLARRRDRDDEHIAPRGARVVGSVAIAALGLVWFAQRAFGWFA